MDREFALRVFPCLEGLLVTFVGHPHEWNAVRLPYVFHQQLTRFLTPTDLEEYQQDDPIPCWIGLSLSQEVWGGQDGQQFCISEWSAFLDVLPGLFLRWWQTTNGVVPLRHEALLLGPLEHSSETRQMLDAGSLGAIFENVFLI